MEETFSGEPLAPTGDPTDPSEWRRREIRREVQEPLDLKLPNGKILAVRTLNMTPWSLAVVSRKPLKAYTTVHVRHSYAAEGDAWISASVVHCTDTVGGYKVGLVLESD